MTFDKYYVVLLKEGPNTSPIKEDDLQTLRKGHLAHLTHLKEAGHMSIAGPVENHSDLAGVEGISVFPATAVDSLEAVKELVEADPAFKDGRLAAAYFTWHVPTGGTMS
jgi:uncharacterized protein YciI